MRRCSVCCASVCLPASGNSRGAGGGGLELGWATESNRRNRMPCDLPVFRNPAQQRAGCGVRAQCAVHSNNTDHEPTPPASHEYERGQKAATVSQQHLLSHLPPAIAVTWTEKPRVPLHKDLASRCTDAATTQVAVCASSQCLLVLGVRKPISHLSPFWSSQLQGRLLGWRLDLEGPPRIKAQF